MTYSGVRKQLAKQREQEQAPAGNPLRCVAVGCPCNGSASSDGYAFACAAHDSVEPHQWPRVTEALRENSWLIELVRDIKTMHDRHENWREFAIRFWSEDADCRPHESEQYQPYENRMRLELLHRCGLRTRPTVRLPRAGAKPGNVGALLGSRA